MRCPVPLRRLTVSLLLVAGCAGTAVAADVLGPVASRPRAGGGADRALATGDVDGDGALDLAWMRGTGVSVALGDGAGAFGPSIVTDTGVVPSGQLVARDVSGDGRLDILLGAEEGTFTAALMMGAPGGALVAAPLPVGTAAGTLPAIADLDGDGDLDAVIAGRGLNVYRNDAGTLALALTFPGDAPQDVRGLATGDLDGDGAHDVVLANLEGTRDGIDVFHFRRDAGSGALVLDERVPADTGLAGRHRIALADMDGDTDLDVVLHGLAAGSGTPLAFVLRNDGLRQLVPGAAVVAPDRVSGAADMLVTDVSGDGLPDVLFGHVTATSREMVVLRGAPGAALAAPTLARTLTSFGRLVAADLDCDGRTDVLGGGAEGLEILLRRASGDEREVSAPLVAHDMVVADFDTDGNLDVAGLDSNSVNAAHGMGCLLAGAPLCAGPPPAADAGADVQRCTPPAAVEDFALSGAGSMSVGGSALTRYCWTTDAGVFAESGTADYCSGATGATLRLSSTSGASGARVTLEVADTDGCADTDTMQVSLLPQPALTLLTTSSDVVCGNASVDLICRASDLLLGTGLVTLTWDFDVARDSNFDGDLANDPDQVLVAVSGEISVATATYTRTGPKTARVRAVSENGTCVATGDVSFRVAAVPEIIAASIPAGACAGTPITATATAVAGDGGSLLLAWDHDISVDADGDGNPGNDVQSTGTPATWSYDTGGTFTARLRAVGDGGCTVSADRTISIFDPPQLGFTAAGTTCDASILTFRDQTTGVRATLVEWSFGDGSLPGIGPVVTHVFPAPGTYRVTETVLDANNCSWTVARDVTIADAVVAIEDVSFFDGQAGTGSAGNANGFAEPGERLQLVVTVSNAGSEEATDVVARARVLAPLSGAAFTSAEADVADVAPGGSSASTTGELTLVLDPFLACGTQVVIQVEVRAFGNDGCTSTRTLTLVAAAPGLERFGAERRLTQLSGATTAPSTAFGAGQHVTVFEDSSTGRAQVFLVRQDRSGIVLQAPTNLSSSPGTVTRAGSPSIAWNGRDQQFGVVWVEDSPGGRDVMFARVATNGNLLATPVTVVRTATAAAPDVAWDGSRWIVAWSSRGSGFYEALWAATFATDGTLLSSAQLVSDVADENAAASLEPALAVSGSTWALAYVRGAAPSATVQVRVFATGGIGLLGTASLGTSNGDAPDAAPLNGLAAIVFANASGQVQAARVDGAAVVRSFEDVGTGTRPALASGPSHAVVVFEQGGEVRARGLDRAGGVFSVELAVSAGTGPSRWPSVGAGDDGFFLSAWSDERPGHAGNSELYSGVVAPSGAPTCSSFRLGDIAPAPGGDGQVNIGDVVLALRITVGLHAPTADTLARGDVAPGQRIGAVHVVIGNGFIDIGDVVVLLQAATGLVTLTR